MLFGSIEFYIFFAAVFSCWLICPCRHRWMVLLASSYIFYFVWKPWYCLILFVCTLATWAVVNKIAELEGGKRKKRLLVVAIAVNLLPLLFYKYFNFFNESLAAVFSFTKISYPIPPLDILLPVGISFYSFQAISYCADVYKVRIEPERHFGHFALYLAFFPKLISGPIERGAKLLPQLRTTRPFESVLFLSGVQLFFWGVFKKIVIADRLDMYVDMVFSNPEDYWGKTVILAVWFFALQIYCDFSAYTDMAIGCGRIFGIELSRNFNFPYFARSVNEFWKCWHITLTSWFRDYVYIPLGGNRVASGLFTLNIMAVFLLSGLWHGAAWTFVLWGGLHGIFYLIEMSTSSARDWTRNFFGIRGKTAAVLQVLITFNLVSLAWIFFRAATVTDAFTIIGHMFVNISLPIRMLSSQFSTALTCGFAVLFIVLELLLYWDTNNDFRVSKAMPGFVKYPVYAVGLLVISLFGLNSNEFIYFHF